MDRYVFRTTKPLARKYLQRNVPVTNKIAESENQFACPPINNPTIFSTLDIYPKSIPRHSTYSAFHFPYSPIALKLKFLRFKNFRPPSESYVHSDSLRRRPPPLPTHRQASASDKGAPCKRHSAHRLPWVVCPSRPVTLTARRRRFCRRSTARGTDGTTTSPPLPRKRPATPCHYPQQ